MERPRENARPHALAELHDHARALPLPRHDPERAVKEILDAQIDRAREARAAEWLDRSEALHRPREVGRTGLGRVGELPQAAPDDVEAIAVDAEPVRREQAARHVALRRAVGVA